jgi:hypothetical protein
MITFTKPDARGWIGIGCYVLVVILLGMMWADKTLLKDDFFKVIATAIILTGWNNGPVGWAYQATKGGGEAAESSARIAEQAAKAALPPDPAEPKTVTVDQPSSEPIPTTVEGTKK